MLVVEQSQTLAMNIMNPARVTNCIPTAKVATVRGQQLVLTPHKLDEVRVLRNLGILAPSPILHYYNWPGQFTPFDHQRKTAAFLTVNQRALVLNEIGTGKTQAALWAADYLMSIGQVKKCLVISPLSTLERVWGDAIFLNLLHRSYTVLHGSAARRKKLVAQDHDFYIVNHDGFNIIADDVMAKCDLVIVDEAAVYRTPSTNRFRHLRAQMKQNPDTKLWLMTGTPTPNAPTDAWTLAQLVESPYCTATFTRFREQTMNKIGPYKWVPRDGSTDIVQHVLQPAVRYTREECFDLPETIFQTRYVPLTKEQEQHYDKMLKELVVDVVDSTGKVQTLSAVNEANKMQKLVQIACGVAYDENGDDVMLDCTPRVNAVQEVIAEAGEKVIIFVPLTGTLNMLSKVLSKTYTVEVVNGSVSKNKRDDIFKRFQQTADPQVLIAHPATMSHGLTLTEAGTIIWYGPIASNEQYIQANGRVERIGKNKTTNVVNIQSTKLEADIYSRLRAKQKLQGILLELVRQQTEVNANAECNYRSSC